MTLSLTTIKIRCRKFSEKFADVTSESGEKQTFYNEFFQIFDKDRFECAIFERAINRLPGTRPASVDLLWPRVLLVEHKSKGRDLDEADAQADDYYLDLDKGIKPRYILTSDFKHFRLRDLEQPANDVNFILKQLADHAESFLFMVGRKRPEKEEQVNIKATKLMDEVYKSMKASKYNESDMGQYLTRLAYCMFGEDAGVFNDYGGGGGGK